MGAIQRIIVMFQEAFEKLQVSVSLKKVEDLAIMVHRAMTAQARKYHTTEHVFQLADPSDPLQSFAALFHDIIYYQVDRGFSPEIYTIISSYIRERGDEIFLIKTINPDDRLFMLTLAVFGFEAGQKLSLFGGLNEFLSALVMHKELEGILPEKDLIDITVCIEATIPFRGKNDNGQSYADILEERLKAINEKYTFFMKPGEIEDVIKRAVVFSNKDVGNFCEKDPSRFLDSTWKLLPEMNASLRSRELYSIRDYRQALQKMEGFLGRLNLDNIFHRYKGVPVEKEFQQMVTYAHTNVSIALEYLRVKLLTIIILEALAEVTGGDVPLSLFMGDLQQEAADVKSSGDFLLVVGESRFIDQSSPVFKLLDSGRASESSFDIKNSPLSAFLYKNIGPAKIKQLLGSAKDMIAGKLSALDFLNSIDRPIVSAIAQTNAQMALTRRKQLLQFSQSDNHSESF